MSSLREMPKAGELLSDPVNEAEYLSEIYAQCRNFIDAWNAVNLQYTKLNHGDFRSVHESFRRFFACVAQSLGHAAIVSKILWPSEKAKRFCKERAECLRAQLQIHSAEFLEVPSRAVRDYFEHVDERLDDSIRGEKWIGGIRHDFSIGAKKEKNTYRRHFDPSSGVFSFFEKNICLPRLLTEMQDISVRVQARSFIKFDSVWHIYVDRSVDSYLSHKCGLGTVLAHASQFMTLEQRHDVERVVFEIVRLYLQGDDRNAISMKSYESLVKVTLPLQSNADYLSGDPDRLNYQLEAFRRQINGT